MPFTDVQNIEEDMNESRNKKYIEWSLERIVSKLADVLRKKKHCRYSQKYCSSIENACMFNIYAVLICYCIRNFN